MFLSSKKRNPEIKGAALRGAARLFYFRGRLFKQRLHAAERGGGDGGITSDGEDVVKIERTGVPSNNNAQVRDSVRPHNQNELHALPIAGVRDDFPLSPQGYYYLVAAVPVVQADLVLFTLLDDRVFTRRRATSGPAEAHVVSSPLGRTDVPLHERLEYPSITGVGRFEIFV